MTLEDFGKRLKRARRIAPGKWIGLCPAHDDQHESLSFGTGENGRLVVKCHAGCSYEEIREAAGLQNADFFNDGDRNEPSRIVATYSYLDENGVALYQVVRREPKSFFQRRPNGQGGWINSLDGVRRVLYRLPELKGQREIIIVEGEKDAGRLAALGLAATTNPAGAGKWRPEYVEQLQAAGAQCVVVIPDNDDPGRRHAEAVVTACRAAGLGGKLVELPGLLPKGDVSDWLDAGHSAEELGRLIAETPAADAWEPPAPAADAWEPPAPAADAWEPPAPLGAATVPAFPTSALPPWLRAWVEETARATQTPLDLAAMLGVAVCAAALARKVVVRVRDGYVEPVNLFTATALPPGNRKSAVYTAATAPLYEWEADETARLKPEITEAATRRAILEQRATKAKEAAARAKPEEREAKEGEAVTLAAQLASALVPAQPRLLADDVSPEKLASLLAEHDGRMAVMSPEGGIFELMGGRYSPNGAPNLDVFLKGHAGDPLRVDRVGRPPEFVHSPALTVGLAVQPEVLRGLADKPGFRGRGLLARFLYAIPESSLGRRDVDAPPASAVTVQGYHRAVKALLALPWGTDGNGDKAAYALSLTPAAQAVLREREAKLEPALAEFGELGDLGDWASKLIGAVVRIAGILHIGDHATDPAPWQWQITDETLRRAASIGDWLIPHARAAFAEMGADPAVERARHLVGWLERAWAADRPLSRRDLFNANRGRYRKVTELDEPLRLMTEHGYLRSRPEEGQRRPGRPASPTYDVNPHVYSAKSALSAKLLPALNSADCANSALETAGLGATATDSGKAPLDPAHAGVLGSADQPPSGGVEWL